MADKNDDDQGPVELPDGRIVAQKWKIIEKIGEGGCGAVYLVEDQQSPAKAKAALKAESNFVDGGSVLKLEVQVLQKLAGRKYVAQLIDAGKRKKYCYMVMTLFGPSLAMLFNLCKREFSASTQVRLGLQMLYGLKQLHDVGYVHRDFKPGNFAIGKKGKATRVIHLLDFGLCREFSAKNDGKMEIRKPRKITLFRGTLRYCSPNANHKGEQGRVDDLWSMVYVLAEMRGSLPWEQLRDKDEIGKMKKETADKKLLSKCPPQMIEIAAHLRELDYYKRPDYAKIYHVLESIMVDLKIKHSELFDWEKNPNYSQLTGDTKNEDVENCKNEEKFEDKPPFAKEEFEKNELGV